jgi:predicted PurR-regulated permease PerM
LEVLKRLVIWALFLAVLYVGRDFFFMAFMTFLFSYFILALVGWIMQRLSPDRDRPGLRRLLTVAVFVVVPLLLLGVGALVAPPLIAQGQRLAGGLSHMNPETEVTHVLEKFVGPSQFKREFGGPGDPRYKKGLEEFRKTGESHVDAYYAFPKVEAWVEGGFSKQFAEAESGRIRARLAREGTSSQDFEQWFLKVKVPELQEHARKVVPEKGRPATSVPPLVQAAASATPEELLRQVRRDPATLAPLHDEWVQDTVARGLAAAKASPLYQEHFRAHYEERRQEQPKATSYTFDQFIELQKVRPQGRRAFGEALEKMNPSGQAESEAQLRADFESAKEHELFQEWWGTSSIAKFVRQKVESGVSGGGSERMERILSSLLSIPLDLGTALLLSFFICIDFPRLRTAVGHLRETWLRDVHNEMAPALSDLGQLIGRAMRAQGMISLCNATIIFLFLNFLGVDHAVLLSAAVFVLCLVPTLGMIIAWVLLAGVAFIQPGGGLALALKVSGAVVFTVFMETFVFSPRILGKLMELHPVLIIAFLPVAQYFFGIWGLILATPVMVYVIYEVILGRGLPGAEETHEAPPDGNAPPPEGASGTAGPVEQAKPIAVVAPAEVEEKGKQNSGATGQQGKAGKGKKK